MAEDRVTAALARIFEATATSETLRDLLEILYENLGDLIDTSNFFVAMWDRESGLYTFPFSVDEADDDFTPQLLNGTITDFVRRHPQPLVLDSLGHQRLIDEGEVAFCGDLTARWMGVPLVTQSGVVGVAVVQSYDNPDLFGQRDLELFEMVCRAVAPAVEQRALARRRQLALLTSRDEAVRANRAKSSFLANMSHELRTPLNAIIGYAELISEDDQDLPVATFATDLDNIRGAARHLLVIIDDILDLSRVDAGKAVVHLSRLSLDDAAADLESALAPLGIARRCRMTGDRTGCIETDRAKLGQILVNLVTNACKFSDEDDRVEVRFERFQECEADWVRFQVVDRGIGIAPDQLENLFHPFTQVDDSHTRVTGGAGLGLAICKQYSVLLNGRISLNSEPGVGSTFTVELPADPPAPGATG